MATNQASSSAPAQEYVVRVPASAKKKYSVLKFNPSNNVDFTKCGSAKLERENNLKEFNLSHDIGVMPKFGAGSEYGREQKEEARKKKYGVKVKKYNPEDQPWILKLGSGKQAKKLKGTKEGGILENASYYIFTQCADGAFEAFPVEEWSNFTPIVKYKHLNAEEAEEEFIKRDKTLNLFSIMVKKRLKNEDHDDPDEEGETKGKKSKKGKEFKLTDLDEWGNISDDSSDEENSGDEDKPKKPKKKAPQKAKAGRKKKRGSDDEALEDSDSVDEGAEVDYMTDTDSDDEDMYNDSARQKTDKYEDKGVVDEDGLRKIIDSGDEDEEEEEKKEGEEEEEEEKEKEKTKKEESGSESSDSGSDSDVEKDANFSSALFMQQKKKKSGSKEVTPNSSRSATPTVPGDVEEGKGKKRKQGDTDSTPSKKSKAEGSPTPSPTEPRGAEGVTEEAVRRYLMRKPMTIKDLLQKLHKNTGLGKDKLVTSIAQILKKLNPEKVTRQKKLYLHIKKE